MTVPPACFRLSVFRNGRLIKKPTVLSDLALREALLVATNFDEARVNFIFRKVEQRGRCELGRARGQPLFVIEKVLQS